MKARCSEAYMLYLPPRGRHWDATKIIDSSLILGASDYENYFSNRPWQTQQCILQTEHNGILPPIALPVKENCLLSLSGSKNTSKSLTLEHYWG